MRPSRTRIESLDMSDSQPVNSTVSSGHAETASGLSRITLRPIGSPLPLGFIALGTATISLSGMQLGWLPAADWKQVALVLVLFTAPLQALSSIFGFLARDSVGGTGLGTLAGAWLVTGAVTATSPAGSTSKALGLFLLVVAAALIVPTVAASLGKVLAALVMGGVAVRFSITGIYELTGQSGWEHVAGWWGVALGAIALYAALAFEIEDTLRRTLLPVGRRGVGRRAMKGTIVDDLGRISHEAGVREQL